MRLPMCNAHATIRLKLRLWSSNTAVISPSWKIRVHSLLQHAPFCGRSTGSLQHYPPETSRLFRLPVGIRKRRQQTARHR